MSEWQPMMTAPKNGTAILIAYRGGTVGANVREARWRPFRGFGAWETWLTNIEDNSPDLLAWMPLPEPPTPHNENER
jgi:hypothetical protein